MTLDEALTAAPLIAIIRGVRPEHALDIGEALIRAGIRVIETPLNSPEPITTITMLSERYQGQAIIGAGTVLTPEHVDRVADAGGRIIVTPNTDTRVIERALKRGLTPFPGFYSPSEALLAVQAGAQRLKLFPASTAGPSHLKAVRAVLAPQTQIYAVGGVRPADWPSWRDAGAAGLGLGSDLYKPGQSAEDTYTRAREAVAHCG